MIPIQPLDGYLQSIKPQRTIHPINHLLLYCRKQHQLEIIHQRQQKLSCEWPQYDRLVFLMDEGIVQHNHQSVLEGEFGREEWGWGVGEGGEVELAVVLVDYLADY